jgi:uncharacterized protein
VDAFRRPEGVKVTYRRMKFDFEDQGFDRYWMDGSPFKSLFWTQLSTAFAPGEKFFIDSARALKDKITDPELREEISEFCRQEGHHTAQHIKFDRINAAMGIDTKGCEARYTWILNRARAKLEPMEMLAATCALEHFTSTFADEFFEYPELSAGGDPKVVALWAWHAAEEAEHRATCYDIYRQLGGSYFERTTILIGAWFLILGAALINTVVLLKKDKKLFTRDTLSGIGYLFGRRGLLTGLAPAFWSYFRPGFHPWRKQDGAHIERWKASNSQYIQNVPTGNSSAA